MLSISIQYQHNIKPGYYAHIRYVSDKSVQLRKGETDQNIQTKITKMYKPNKDTIRQPNISEKKTFPALEENMEKELKVSQKSEGYLSLNYCNKQMNQLIRMR